MDGHLHDNAQLTAEWSEYNGGKEGHPYENAWITTERVNVRMDIHILSPDLLQNKVKKRLKWL